MFDDDFAEIGKFADCARSFSPKKNNPHLGPSPLCVLRLEAWLYSSKRLRFDIIYVSCLVRCRIGHGFLAGSRECLLSNFRVQFFPNFVRLTVIHIVLLRTRHRAPPRPPRSTDFLHLNHFHRIRDCRCPRHRLPFH